MKDKVFSLYDSLMTVAPDNGVNSRPDNKYDGFTDLDKPKKSDIKTIISDYIAASPLIKLVKKLSVTNASVNSSVVYIPYRGTVITGDFAQYHDVLSLAGSAMLGLSHMFALYIIFRKND
jgi:hypothetical protein